MSLYGRIADRLDRRILKIHDRRRSDDEPWPLWCHAHPEPQKWPCDDWFRAVTRIKARRHEPKETP